MKVIDSEDESEKQDPTILWDKAVLKEMQAIPAAKRDQFLLSLRLVQQGSFPALNH